MADFKTQALLLIDSVRSGEIDVTTFCERYETLWNFERKLQELNDKDSELLEALFDIAAAYSPNLEERDRIPRYKSERDVLDKAAEVRKRLS